eukprot:scaffold101_cov230-Pinguiococcus_pyrenoidosus.AAC.15
MMRDRNEPLKTEAEDLRPKAEDLRPEPEDLRLIFAPTFRLEARSLPSSAATQATKDLTSTECGWKASPRFANQRRKKMIRAAVVEDQNTRSVKSNSRSMSSSFRVSPTQSNRESSRFMNGARERQDTRRPVRRKVGVEGGVLDKGFQDTS